jgi:hypothetical protein
MRSVTASAKASASCTNDAHQPPVGIPTALNALPLPWRGFFIQQLPLPLAHLDGMDGVISSDLLDRLPIADRFNGDPGLEFGAMGAALAHGWEPRSGAVPSLRG